MSQFSYDFLPTGDLESPCSSVSISTVKQHRVKMNDDNTEPKLELLLEFCGKWHCSCFARFWQDCNQLLSLKSFPSLVINWALPMAGCPLESVKHSSEIKSPQYLFIPLMALKPIAKSPDLTLQLDKHIKETMLVFPGISRGFQYTFLISSALCRYVWNILPKLHLVLSWKIKQVDSLL